MKNKLFPGITVNVVCLPECDKEIGKLFFDCLKDYVIRFNKPVQFLNFKVQICAVEYPIGAEMGITMFNEEDDRILIQVKDPFVSECEYSDWAMEKFVCVLCHEIVHACQHLTGSTGIKIPKFKHGDIDIPNIHDKYFFDPIEIEARILESVYATYYGHTLL